MSGQLSKYNLSPMKNFLGVLVFLFIALVVLSSNTKKNQNDNGLAVVAQLDGKYIFFYSSPYHQHDTVFRYATIVASNNADKGIRAAMKKAFKISQEKGVEFDGIITGQGQYDYAIKFKE